jgi:hypothetical protein
MGSRCRRAPPPRSPPPSSVWPVQRRSRAVPLIETRLARQAPRGWVVIRTSAPPSLRSQWRRRTPSLRLPPSRVDPPKHRRGASRPHLRRWHRVRQGPRRPPALLPLRPSVGVRRRRVAARAYRLDLRPGRPFNSRRRRTMLGRRCANPPDSQRPPAPRRLPLPAKPRSPSSRPDPHLCLRLRHRQLLRRYGPWPPSRAAPAYRARQRRSRQPGTHGAWKHGRPAPLRASASPSGHPRRGAAERRGRGRASRSRLNHRPDSKRPRAPNRRQRRGATLVRRSLRHRRPARKRQCEHLRPRRSAPRHAVFDRRRLLRAIPQTPTLPPPQRREPRPLGRRIFARSHRPPWRRASTNDD